MKQGNLHKISAFLGLTMTLSAWAAPQVIEVKIPNATNVKLSLSEPWQQSNVLASENVPYVELYSDKSKSVSLQLSFMEGKNDKFSTQSKLEKEMKAEMEKQYLPGSVEKKVNLEKLNSKNYMSTYAKFTDAHLAKSKDLNPPHYKYVSTGVLVIGKTIGAFTLLSNSTESEEYKKMFKFLENNISKK